MSALSKSWPSHRLHLWGALAAFAAAFLVVPALSGAPARLATGCAGWISIAVVFELLSMLGFGLVFKLVFAARTSWRRCAPAALCALSASTFLPAGGLIGPTIGAWSASTEKPSPSQLARSTVTFLLLTTAPGVIILGVFGLLLWLGLASGPDTAALTLLPAALALGLLAATWLMAHSAERQPSRHRGIFSRGLVIARSTLSESVAETHSLLLAGNWKLLGALAYYAFDNAVLWAAFHAYGHAPPLGVVVMGYLVGSVAAALPIPGGIGAVDGGMIGALLLYGALAAPAAAAVLLYRGISLSLPLVLGVIAWTSSPAARRPPRIDPGRTGFVGRASAKRRPAPELVPSPHGLAACSERMTAPAHSLRSRDTRLPAVRDGMPQRTERRGRRPDQATRRDGQ